MLDPHNYLLTNVTALRETHRIIKICLRHDGSFVHVDSIARNARLDAQRFGDVFANNLRSGCHQFIAQLSGIVCIDEQIESIFGCMRRANDPHVTTTIKLRFQTFPGSGFGSLPKNGADHFGSFPSLHRIGSRVTRQVSNAKIAGLKT